MNFKKLSILFCSLLALTSVMAVSAAETETVSETEAVSAEESTVSGADEEPNIPSRSSMPTAKPSSRANRSASPPLAGKTRTRRWHSALLP
ncbi:MAG: hypothetical protein ACLR6B_21200 [Blautia sp.]